MKNTKFYGIDASNEISLLEYGLLVAPYHKDGRKDEFLCLYKIGEGEFDSGYITEKQVNGYILGSEFPSASDISSFLSFVGCTQEEWINNSFVTKLYDLFQFWGYDNIMGSCYYPKSLADIEAITGEKYELA